MNLQLSDGTTLQIPDDATPEAIRNFAARGEAHIKANPRPAAAAAEPDPYSSGNTIGRIATDAVLGLPDLAIGLSNLISKPGDWVAEKITGQAPGAPDLPTLAPMARAKIGVEELPADASYMRRILESGASSLPYGAAGIVRQGAAGLAGGGVRGATMAGGREALRNTVIPTITGDAGAQVGGAVGGPGGALIGGLIGGAAPSAKPIADNWVQGRYVGKGDPNAPAIAAAASRLGIEPTSGALGGPEIQRRENRYVSNDPTGFTARAQQTQRNAMQGAGEDIATQRGATGASVAAIGDDIVSSTTDRLAADRDYSSAGQENLQRTVGDRAPVRVIDLINEARQAYPHMSVPGRQALEYRMNQLMPLINQRDANGNPVIGPNSTVPYELVKQFRTELGQSFDQGRIPRNRELYEPTTNAMAETAQRAGVPRTDFNQVQSFTRGVEGEGGLAERLDPYTRREPRAAYDYTLEGGLQNPDRITTFATETAGDPRQARVFGNYLQQKLAETLGTGGARGMNNLASVIENADPRAISAIAGAFAPQLRDLATLARGVNVPTAQTGLGQATGGVARDLGGRLLGSGVAGQAASAIDPMLGAPATGLAYMAKPALTWINQRIMQSDAAKRGLTGAPMPTRPMSMEELVRILNVVSQSQPAPVEQ